MRLYQVLDCFSFGIVGVWGRTVPVGHVVAAPLAGILDYSESDEGQGTIPKKVLEVVQRVSDEISAAVPKRGRQRRISDKPISPHTLEHESGWVIKRVFSSETPALVFMDEASHRDAVQQKLPAGTGSVLDRLYKAEITDVFTGPEGCGLGSWLYGIGEIVDAAAKHREANPGAQLMSILSQEASTVTVDDVRLFNLAADVYQPSFMRKVSAIELVPGSHQLFHIIMRSESAVRPVVEFSSAERTEPTQAAQAAG